MVGFEKGRERKRKGGDGRRGGEREEVEIGSDGSDEGREEGEEERTGQSSREREEKRRIREIVW